MADTDVQDNLGDFKGKSGPDDVINDKANVLNTSAMEDIVAKQYFFGCGSCHPRWLQLLFARKKVFTFLLSVNVLLQSSLVSGVISSILSTIERRYSFSSTAAGLMVISYDITIFISVLFISYFGSKTHQPRLLGVCMVLMGFGSLLFSSPQFLFGHYENGSGNSSSQILCNDQLNATNSDCSPTNNIAYAIFVLSNIIIGVSSTPLYTIGYAYIDEIVYPKYVSLHIGAVGVIAVCGPLVGYGFGSVFLSIYVDPWRSTNLTSSDPSWVGAWWIPLVIIAMASFILSVPLLMFPRYLPDSHLVQQERIKEMQKTYPSKYANENNVSIIFKMLPIHIKRLLTNFSFLFAILALSFSFTFLQGAISFAPKYFEVQYKFTAFTSGLVVAAIGIPGGVLGTLVGAFIVFGCKLRGRKNALIILVCVLTIIPLVSAFLIHCPETPIAGVTTSYADGSQNGGVCLSSCNCTSNIFEPVCGNDNLTYVSPCQAGCISSTHIFENCSCVSNVSGTATNGLCDSQCIIYILPLLLLSLLLFLSFIIQIPYFQFIIRVVADDQRALALGVQSGLSRILGSVPGPLIFGLLFDDSCLLWQEECGLRGNCWIYDRSQLSYNVILLGFPTYFLGFVFFFLAWLTFSEKKEDNTNSDTLELNSS